MDDYKAMVCILNSGGMDSFNMLVPRGTSYAEYAASRSNMALSQNEQANYAVQSISNNRLSSLKKYAESMVKAGTDAAHFGYAIERINNPKEISLPQHKEIPPGAPIGCDLDF